LITVDFSLLVFLYVSAGIALIFGLWLYYDARDARVYERERAHSLYHCLKCGRLYSAPRFNREADCPGCAFRNSKLKF
jgi:hypothetical protein